MVERLAVQKLLAMLEEDVLPEDVTSKAVKGIKSRASIIAKEDGLLAGNKFIILFLEQLGFKILDKMTDGSAFKKGDRLLEFEGDGEDILVVERLILNILSRLSGIATITSHMVKLARSVNPNIIIAGTRKTTPGLRIFEKYAIEVGGGDPHRYNLSDMVLIKDNHIALLGGVKPAIEKVKKYVSFSKKIEVEVTSLKEALEAYEAGADIILLDNMSPKEIEEVVERLKGKILLEASGRITPENILEYAKTGVDIISSGYITHSVKSIDLSLDIKKID
ncbi:carboxylating nicotinate-nucleotide diphosphorylase [Stygiolobus caldivivus]|uniref:carboxylating nicotinate-nucleotide diphosphorylase n=1 Tax=Stygiolobus caldivivus TaxID=2824673 RepID=UPI001C851C46|nr:carboxylating nicotinate-nucleotide diphosphorylase [Stygiolobus caldivivus]